MTTKAERANSFNQAIGNWLRDARLKAGVTTGEAALQINASVKQIKAIETGSLSPTGEEFYTLIAAYGIAQEDANAFLKDYGMQTQATIS